MAIPGQESQGFQVPQFQAGVHQVDLVVIYCPGTKEGVCYLDNLTCAAEQ